MLTNIHILGNKLFMPLFFFSFLFLWFFLYLFRISKTSFHLGSLAWICSDNLEMKCVVRINPAFNICVYFSISETNTGSMLACCALASMRTRMRRTWWRPQWCWRQERRSSGPTNIHSPTSSPTLLEEHPMRDTSAIRWADELPLDCLHLQSHHYHDSHLSVSRVSLQFFLCRRKTICVYWFYTFFDLKENKAKIHLYD